MRVAFASSLLTVLAGCGAGPAEAPAEGEVGSIARGLSTLSNESFTGGWSSYWHANWCTYSYSCDIVPCPAAAGSCFRAEFRGNDYLANPSRPRKGDELAGKDGVPGSSSWAGTEHWVGMKVYFSRRTFGPDTWPVIILQAHDVPHDTDPSRNPVYGISYNSDSSHPGTLRFGYKGSKEWITPRDSSGAFVYTDHGTIVLGEPLLDAWNHFVVHVKWAPKTKTGFAQVWFNGVFREKRDIYIGFNDPSAPYLKFGHYWYSPKKTDAGRKRISYVDNVKIVTGSGGSYCDVAPPGAPDPTMPAGTTCKRPNDPVDPGARTLTPTRTTICVAPAVAIKPASVRASSWDDLTYPSNAMDGDLATRWSAEGASEWLEFDLGASYRIDRLAVAFYKGNQRRSTIDVWAGADADPRLAVGSFQSSGTSNDLQAWTPPMPPVARFVRLTSNGTSADLWNSLTEVVLCGEPAAPPVLPDAGSDGAGPADPCDGDGGCGDDVPPDDDNDAFVPDDALAAGDGPPSEGAPTDARGGEGGTVGGGDLASGPGADGASLAPTVDSGCSCAVGVRRSPASGWLVVAAILGLAAALRRSVRPAGKRSVVGRAP